jgi:hypothetical protein
MTQAQIQLAQAKGALDYNQKSLTVSQAAREALAQAEEACNVEPGKISNILKLIAESQRIQLDWQIETQRQTIAQLTEAIQIAESPVARATIVPPTGRHGG